MRGGQGSYSRPSHEIAAQAAPAYRWRLLPGERLHHRSRVARMQSMPSSVRHYA
jgi:hypothetical protein